MVRCSNPQLIQNTCTGLHPIYPQLVVVVSLWLSDTNTNVTSVLLLPVLSIRVENEAGAAFLPLQLDLLLKEPLLHAFLLGDVLVQSLVSLPLLTRVIVLQRSR